MDPLSQAIRDYVAANPGCNKAQITRTLKADYPGKRVLIAIKMLQLVGLIAVEPRREPTGGARVRLFVDSIHPMARLGS